MKRGLVVALFAILVLAAGAAGAWMLFGPGFGGKTDDPGNAAGQPLTAELPASPGATPPPTAPPSPAAPAAPQEQFSRAAVIDDPNGYTNVHSGPSPVAPIVARVSAGESVTTYDQGGDWWRVRTAGGLIGFMPRSRIALRGEAPPVQTAGATPADGNQLAAADTPTAATPRRPPRPRSRINRANSENMRAFCQNAGRGTPQCRQFRRDLGGR